MKKQNTIPDKMFNDGVAISYIEWAVANLPNIMFVVGILLRIGIGAILWMHTVEILSLIKDTKLRYVLAFIFVVPVEAFLTATSFASAGLWKRAGTLKLEGRFAEATTYNYWAWGFLTVTLLGSLLFNAVMLAYTQEMYVEGDNVAKEASKYFVAIHKGMSWQVMMFIQTMNVMAVLASEGSAFLLNNNFSNSQVSQEPNRVTQNSNASYSDVGARADKLRFGTT